MTTGRRFTLRVAGQGIEVLFRFCATFLDGVRERANRLIEQSMEEGDRISRAPRPQDWGGGGGDW
ncbi:integrase [Streptomyces sp. NPDC085529]|uniref:integrase n=1 Tax=Streptomyces sp. NPDC085529 TaxID=3365729 RepID=UPI0037D32CC9